MKDQIEQLIDRCRSADIEAINLLWELYFPRLCALGKKNLPLSARRVHDEEDVAAGVLEKLFHGLSHGAYARVHNRDELWALLVTVTLRRVANVNDEVAAFLNNKKRRDLSDMEEVGKMVVQILGDEGAFPESLEMQCKDADGRDVHVPT